jgi:hypothetical protein
MNKIPQFNCINKATLLLLSSLFFGFSLFAQKNTWTFGFNAGFKQDINPVSENYRHIILGQRGFSQQVNLCFSYFFHDNFAIESGLYYSSTKLPSIWASTLLHTNLSWEERVLLKSPSTLYHSLQIPVLLSSSFSIWKNLKFYAKTGLCISFMIPDNFADTKLKGELTGTSINNDITYKHILSYDVRVNTVQTAYELLFNSNIGIGYEFPLGLGISFNANFAQGFIVTTEVLTSYGYHLSSEYGDFFTSGYENISLKTNYYNLTLGFFYKIKSKKK